LECGDNLLDQDPEDGKILRTEYILLYACVLEMELRAARTKMRTLGPGLKR
jgi:hypothetical protein